MELCLHSGSHSASLNEVANVNTPAARGRWQPLPHIELIESVRRVLADSPLQVESEDHALSEDDARYFGVFGITSGNGWRFAVGLRNSHDQRFSAALCAGSHVFVCDNLAFSAEIVIARRHTTFIRQDLNRLVPTAVSKMVEMKSDQDRRIGAYESHEISDPVAHDFFCKAVRGHAIAPSQLGKVLDSWYTPEHEEFKPRTVWSAFNAVTEHLKNVNLHDLPRRTVTLHGLADVISGLEPASVN